MATVRWAKSSPIHMKCSTTATGSCSRAMFGQNSRPREYAGSPGAAAGKVMAMKTLKSLVLVSAAVVALSGAASAQIGKGDAPVQITSKQGEYIQNEGKGVFTGDVVATQSDAKITTDKLTVYCSRSTPANAKASECEAMEQLIAEGNVLYIAPDVKIRGDRAVYDYANDTITITGDVIMSRGADGVVQDT